MSGPLASAEQIAFYREHGWLTVASAVCGAELAQLQARCAVMKTRPDFAMDIGAMGSRDAKTAPDPVYMSMLEMVWLNWQDAAFHRWTRAFARSLAGVEVTLWYNQLYYKPPKVGAATHWHQDAAYLGRANEDKLITCWLALSDVSESGGCMQFLDRGHRLGVVDALRSPDGYYGRRDWRWPTGYSVVRCPLKAGGVTFHEGRAPHMTQMNSGETWREVLIQRFLLEGASPLTAHLHGD